MEKSKNRSNFEFMHAKTGEVVGCKIYGKYDEMGYLIRSQVNFAQTDPLHQRQIEVVTETFGPSHIYANQKINQEEYKTEEGKQKLIDEILLRVTPTSTIIFDNQARKKNSKHLLFGRNQIPHQTFQLDEKELQMTPEDHHTFEKIVSNVQLDPNKWADE